MLLPVRDIPDTAAFKSSFYKSLAFTQTIYDLYI